MPDSFDPSLLDICEQERLDRIGAIQPYGVLLGGDAGDPRVRVASADAADWLGVPGTGVLNRPLAALLPVALADFPDESGQKRVLPGLLETPRGWLDAILCNAGAEWLLELEPQGADDPAQPLANPLVGRLLEAPQSELELDRYAGALADVVRHTTGFHRALVYRFLPDDCGEVIAESCLEGPPRYLGMRFPASDIPKIARDLYRINSHRQIPDIEAAPVPILSFVPGREADLTLSDLRAVSPVHLEYLRNMQVAGSLSISILVGGTLWGLVACHHDGPRYLSLRVRGRCVELTQSFALGIGSYLVNERLRRATGMEDRLAALVERLSDGLAELPSMSLVGPPMMALFKAGGVAVVNGRGAHTYGSAPDPAEILEIDRWLLAQPGDQVYATDRLGAESGLAVDPGRAAGLLMVPARSLREGEPGARFYWFRPEQPRTVHWAGDPVKPLGVNPDTGTLSPRRSFELWVNTTRGSSDPWNELDMMGARMLRIVLPRGGTGRE